MKHFFKLSYLYIQEHNAEPATNAENNPGEAVLRPIDAVAVEEQGQESLNPAESRWGWGGYGGWGRGNKFCSHFVIL